MHISSRGEDQLFCLFSLVKFVLSLRGMWWTLSLQWGCCQQYSELAVSGSACRKQAGICIGEQVWLESLCSVDWEKAQVSYCPRVEMSSQSQLHRHEKVMSLPHWLRGWVWGPSPLEDHINVQKQNVRCLQMLLSGTRELPKAGEEWNGSLYRRAPELDVVEPGVWLLALPYLPWNVLEPQFPCL